MSSDLFFFPPTSIRSPYYNLAVEESIALHLASLGLVGGIRLWVNPRSIILGLSEDPKKNIKPSVLENFLKTDISARKPNPNAVYIARRASGGGTVYHSPTGNINYSIYVNLDKRKELFAVRDSYDILLRIVARALAKQDIGASPKGKSDLAMEESGILRKISGNAQFRKKNCIVQHGTLILKKELIGEVSDLLLHPPEEPDYRKERSHSDFLTALPSSFSTQQFQKDLFREFADYLGVKTNMENPDFSFFGRGFSTFRKVVLKESEIIRRRKYESLPFILNREIPT
ncbi:lipoate--protein ligase family protein [Leptospira ilyithenensis]|uniref:Lipoate--protein ligase family protein n=1 Tax=Leptospira ilyithenensis TaxID=2484901 RepID=A0A4R9LTF5_9LEPT|nr:lipoate--protein ligase family protein [Leptospira ilyithenensis]TGN16787.1 lipoate--protein ligase family protein [Leptospira ilyithenensis]